METLERVRERFDGLLTEREAGERRIEELDRLIAEGIASGDDVSDLRSERDGLVTEVDDQGEALRVLDDRRARIEAERRGAKRDEQLVEARHDRDALLAACEDFDAKLAELEEAYGRVTRAELKLATSARTAGRGDGGRIARNLRKAVEWAVWRSAPAVAEAAKVPRSNSNRRALRESVGNLAPDME